MTSMKDQCDAIFKPLENEIGKIEQTVQNIKNKCIQKKNEEKPKRNKMDITGEVIDSNPYSRLVALERMGIVKNYQNIRNYSVLIVGVGGVGSVAAEMLTRCGIGKLILYDYDKVEMANMNRMFFIPSQIGMSKVDAAIQTLNTVNPDVELIGRHINVTNITDFNQLLTDLKIGGKDGKSEIDLVLGCVDNFEARISINQACNECDIIWLESGVSENAMNGHIQFMEVGITACFECSPPLIVAANEDEKSLKREGVCAASLPTTIGIVAGLLVQAAMKYLMKLEMKRGYIGYNGLKDFFPEMVLLPNKECPNSHCRERQKEKFNRINEMKKDDDNGNNGDNGNDTIIHETNEYHIELVDESTKDKTETNQIADGIYLKYDLGTNNDDNRMTKEENTIDEPKVNEENEMSLLELKKQLEEM
ncbi:hypothetical protein SNEBB_006631 [Seison nebaliae]|nr:hypothetical protein SNEBB_006631 [Seison nebaliae]